MPIITKKYLFCASHQYWNPKWTKEQNYSVFGLDINNHGHNYELEVSIEGPIDQETGFVINLKVLNKIVEENVIEYFDHHQIEKDIPWFSGKQPSTENMVIYIWDKLVAKINEPTKLNKIRLKETKNIYTEYSGSKKDKNDR